MTDSAYTQWILGTTPGTPSAGYFPGLVAHWPCDDGPTATHLRDATGNTAHNLTLVPGVPGGAVGGAPPAQPSNFGRTIFDAAMTAGSNVMTSATAKFDSRDVNQAIFLPADALTNTFLPKNTYIVSITNPTTVVLSNITPSMGGGFTATEVQISTVTGAWFNNSAPGGYAYNVGTEAGTGPTSLNFQTSSCTIMAWCVWDDEANQGLGALLYKRDQYGLTLVRGGFEFFWQALVSTGVAPNRNNYKSPLDANDLSPLAVTGTLQSGPLPFFVCMTYNDSIYGGFLRLYVNGINYSFPHAGGTVMAPGGGPNPLGVGGGGSGGLSFGGRIQHVTLMSSIPTTQTIQDLYIFGMTGYHGFNYGPTFTVEGATLTGPPPGLQNVPVFAFPTPIAQQNPNRKRITIINDSDVEINLSRGTTGAPMLLCPRGGHVVDSSGYTGTYTGYHNPVQTGPAGAKNVTVQEEY